MMWGEGSSCPLPRKDTALPSATRSHVYPSHSLHARRPLLPRLTTLTLFHCCCNCLHKAAAASLYPSFQVPTQLSSQSKAICPVSSSLLKNITIQVMNFRALGCPGSLGLLANGSLSCEGSWQPSPGSICFL